jgi:hypothetical protein
VGPPMWITQGREGRERQGPTEAIGGWDSPPPQEKVNSSDHGLSSTSLSYTETNRYRKRMRRYASPMDGEVNSTV